MEPSDLVRRPLDKFTALWWSSVLPSGEEAWGPTYARAEQRAREGALAAFLRALVAELEAPPRSAAARQTVQTRITDAFVPFARRALDFSDAQLEMLLSRGITDMSIEFAQAARRFDAAISGADIFQASRNIWTVSGLQILLGQGVRLRPAHFAYSMLYPYTDNYLDDPAVPPEEKGRFNERFGRRLAGEEVAPANAQERVIYDLVGMIEAQYDRAQHPHVYAGLRAIHAAQERSVRLLRRQQPPYEVDVLGISLEKGGASVLADGYLVSEALTQGQADFMFGFGAFLQLVDDLQDVRQDARDGLMTVFSQPAGRWPLDPLIDHTLAFGLAVMQEAAVGYNRAAFDAPGIEPLAELMHKASLMLLLDAAGQAGRYCTRAYLRELETHSPFRFSFLARVRRELARRRVSFGELIEAFAAAA